MTMKATTIKPTDLDIIEGLPTDMRLEVEKVFAAAEESEVEYEVAPVLKDDGYLDTAVRTHYLYFPRCGRGAACLNGDSQWTDATSMDDLKDRWANYDERWSN